MVELTAAEARVLGALMEKEVTTPEYYPLSLNALVAACNQKSSREPVMQLSDRDAESALRSLETHSLVRADHGSRVERYENRARTVFHLRRDETALLCLLLLRGPQTPGELRGRAERLFAFEDVPQVMAALQRMSTPSEERTDALVQVQERQPGSREARYAHTLCGALAVAAAGVESAQTAPASGDLQSRVERLERALAELQTRVEAFEERTATER